MIPGRRFGEPHPSEVADERQSTYSPALSTTLSSAPSSGPMWYSPRISGDPQGARRLRSSVPSRSQPTRPTPHAIRRRCSRGLAYSPTETDPGTVIQVPKLGTS
jgi:hypothetical protein